MFNMAKMTWQEFTEWQRWDEFLERADNPPMTVDVMFFYNDNTYFIMRHQRDDSTNQSLYASGILIEKQNDTRVPRSKLRYKHAYRSIFHLETST